MSTISSRNTSLWAVLMFAATPGAMPTEARFTSATFTNQIQATSPCLLGVTDSRANHWPLTEVSYVNPRTIALWNRLSPMLCGHCYALQQVSSPSGSDVVDVSWEVLRMHGTIYCEHSREVMPDLYFYAEPEKTEEEEQTRLLLKRQWPKENFRVNGLPHLLNLLLPSPGSQTGLKACRCPGHPSTLKKTGALSQPLTMALQLPLLRTLKR